MPNQYQIGTLVNVADEQGIWKILEIWSIGYIASVSNEIIDSNLFVVSNTSKRIAKVVRENEIFGIDISQKKAEAPVPEKAAGKNRKK